MTQRRIALVAVAVFALAQLVPVSLTNPSVEAEIDVAPEVRAVLERSCFDCHSHATRWPWYARVAPASWLVARDVGEGREHLNFSTWGRYDAEERAEKLVEIGEVVAEGEMPPWFYLPLHPDARLTDADRAVLRGWSEAASGPRERSRHRHDPRGGDERGS
jgi:hypothetical protein